MITPSQDIQQRAETFILTLLRNRGQAQSSELLKAMMQAGFKPYAYVYLSKLKERGLVKHYPVVRKQAVVWTLTRRGLEAVP